MSDLSRLEQCTLCPKLGKEHVPSYGNLDARFMFIGQSPGADEVKQGQPFVGQSGKLYQELLDKLDLKREDVYTTNTLKCHPPANRYGEPEEIKNCYDKWLKKEIVEVNPDVIVFLGKDAWSIVPKEFEPRHGKTLQTHKRFLIFYYHPAYFLYQNNREEFLKLAEILERKIVRNI